MRGYGPALPGVLPSISRKIKNDPRQCKNGQKRAWGVGGSEFLMRRNLFVVARGGGSEILRPRVQDGGERSGGVKFPSSSPKHFFVLFRERAAIVVGGQGAPSSRSCFFEFFSVCFSQCLCRGSMRFSRFFSLWSRDLQKSDFTVGEGALADFSACGVAICKICKYHKDLAKKN